MYYLLNGREILTNDSVVVTNYLSNQKTGDEDYQDPIEDYLKIHFGLIKAVENIFDFIEEGDLVEMKTTGSIHSIIKPYTDGKLYVCNWYSLELDKLINDNNIIAIYKKIDNATYKLIGEVNDGKEN